MQCYVLLFDTSLRVVLGKKGSRVTRIGGLPVKATSIGQNPEQWVIPGGASKVNEKHDVAAKREFQEETGVDVDTLEVDGIMGALMNPHTHDEFYVLYIRMSPGNLAAVAQTIDRNIRMELPADDELISVDVFTHAKAMQELSGVAATPALRRDWYYQAVGDLSTVDEYMDAE